jgi:hypothetical protein
MKKVFGFDVYLSVIKRFELFDLIAVLVLANGLELEFRLS